MKHGDEVRGLKVAKMLHHLYLRKVLGKGPADEKTLLKAAGYRGYGGYEVIKSLENQGLIAKQGGGYVIMGEGEQRIRPISLMTDFIFKFKIYYLLIALGIYLVELVILYYLAPAMVNLPLILMATGLLLILLGVALRLAGELLTRRTE